MKTSAMTTSDFLERIGRRTDLDETERRCRLEVSEKILTLKEKRNAIFLVHNYQRDEIQDLADITGDSLALARAATKADKDVIVFCGVQFMAESAAILNPGKVVLLPVLEAGCPLADMATVYKLREMRARYPDAAACCYINSSAEVKAESDICCTSANAVKVVRSLTQEEVIFLPDGNLGRWVQRHTDKRIIAWEGWCVTHTDLRADEVAAAKAKAPDAKIVAHPECNPDVLDLADHVTSTGGMLTYVAQTPAKRFIICTEEGMAYPLRQAHPDREFIVPSASLICETMKLTTLAWLLNALETMEHKVRVPDEVAARARTVLDRMLAVA